MTTILTVKGVTHDDDKALFIDRNVSSELFGVFLPSDQTEPEESLFG
jgi:hypothetical protein